MATHRASTTALNRIQILLIEDNPLDVTLVKRALAQSTSPKFDVVAVDTHSAGLDHLRSVASDVVLYDLSLPDGQGLNALQHMLQHAASRPIIVLTGMDDEQLAVQAVQAGAQDYLIKGQDELQGLGRAVRYAIERKRHEEVLRSSIPRGLVGEILQDLRSIGNLSEHAMYQSGQRLAQRTEGKTIAEALDRFSTMGLGMLRLVEMDNVAQRWTFYGQNLVEVDLQAQRPTCHYTRGFLRGLIDNLHDHTRLADVELDCQSTGQSDCCFVVGSF